jgi:hypothetical protein
MHTTFVIAVWSVKEAQSAARSTAFNAREILGKESLLQMHTATTEGALLCAPMKSWRRLWKSNQRFAERA